MAVTLRVFDDGDDALLVWSVPQPIPGCLGFAIRRELTRDGKTQASWLPNHTGFKGQPHAEGETRPSTQWPFQAFTWTDHDVGQGDVARYRVVPVVQSANGTLARRDALRSDWEPADQPQAASAYRAFFNRGYVISQFMARYLEKSGKTLKEFKDGLGDADERAIRTFLSGDLRVELLRLLGDAQGDVYAALFELSDTELLDALCALGKRAHVVLANGSIKHKGEDENATGRVALHASKVQVIDRMIGPGALGHNKFLVAGDTVWTGSTNWTPTGLCTQLNNGLLIGDAAIAQIYMQQWRRLARAKSTFPASLVNANSKPKPAGTTTIWFSRTTGKVDLAALRAEVDSAKHAILALMFMPGTKGILPDLLRRDAETGMFVRGVVSELPDVHDESTVDVTIVGGGPPTTHRLDVIQPEGIEHPVAGWAAEVTHKQFLKDVGFAIVHSKVLVIDPLSDSPTVITGSHNFSESASTTNDENFLVIRGEPALARAYLVNVLSAWRHYRARVTGTSFPGLATDDTWMAGALNARRRDAAFWGF
jgi:phosphatidylserine/phosphatidylglycerophosphate/cardiolipin synthase-like enzyme